MEKFSFIRLAYYKRDKQTNILCDENILLFICQKYDEVVVEILRKQTENIQFKFNISKLFNNIYILQLINI